MKIFIGQKVIGQDRERLKEESKEIEEILREKGHEPIHIVDYPSEFAEKSKRERLGQYAFKRIDECDVFLAIVRSEDKSEGMLIEIGHILDSDKKIVLLINKNVTNTYLREIADKVIEFTDGELLIKLKELYV